MSAGGDRARRVTAKLVTWLGWTPARPDVARGLRAATATVMPVLAAHELHRPALVWMALGGWMGTLADAGGAYASRMRAIGAFALGASVAAFVATVAGGSLWTAVPAMFAWAFGASLLRVFGASGSTLATLLTVTFASALARPGDARTALATAGLLVAGSLVALVLALVLWPVYPHRPVRRATAAVYRALGSLARAAGALVAEGAPTGDARWQDRVRALHRPLRDALERARAISLATRARRPGPSAHGDGLRVLIEGADLSFGALIAAEEALEGAGVADAPAAAALGAVAAACDAPADALERAVAMPDPSALDAATQAFVADASLAHDAAAAYRLHGARVLARLGSLMHAAVEAVDALAMRPSRRAAPAPARAPSLRPLAQGPTLRDALRVDALPFQHGVRVAIAAAVSVAIAAWLPLGRGYWLTLTVIVVLQPTSGLTRGRGVARALGTVLGGLVAALLAALTHNPVVMIALMFPLSVAAVAVQPLSYGLFTFFLTPVFVMLALQSSGDWHVAALRVVYSVLGGALALAAANLLWPSWEGQRLRAALARMLREERAYLELVQDAVVRGARDDRRVAHARRRLGAAINEADLAFEQSLGQPGGSDARTEAAQTLLTYARRFAGALTVLASTADPAQPAPSDVATTARRLADGLGGLIDALEGRDARAAGALGVDPVVASGDDVQHAQLERLARSVRVMARAIERARV